MSDLESSTTELYADSANLASRAELHRLFSTNPQTWFQWLWEHMPEGDKASILELGCGSGTLWQVNAHRVSPSWQVVLSDASPAMLRACLLKLCDQTPGVSLLLARAETIPFRDGRFDVVLAHHMLYHVRDLFETLREIRRVLKPGGTLYASTVGQGHMRELWHLLEPFVPDIHERVAPISASFNLDNGTTLLSQVFEHVTLALYEDALAITSVRPAIAYLRSLPILRGGELDANDWASVRRRLVATIELKGAYHVTKRVGLFIARTSRSIHDLSHSS